MLGTRLSRPLTLLAASIRRRLMYSVFSVSRSRVTDPQSAAPRLLEETGAQAILETRGAEGGSRTPDPARMKRLL